MARNSQARGGSARPESTEISVDLNETDPDKAVRRESRPRSDIASDVRDNAAGRSHSNAEREMFKRMSRFSRSIEKKFDQRLAEAEARHQREMSDLRKSYDGVKVEGRDEQAATDHEAKMADFQRQLEAAIERGDSAAQARITTEMMKADGAYHAKLAGATQRRDTAGTGNEGAAQAQAVRRTGPTQAGARFITANGDWWDDPEFAVEKDAAGGIYVRLTNDEGWDANSDDTFEEVARRLKTKFPDLPVAVKGGKRLKAKADDDDQDDLGDGPDDGDDDDDDEDADLERSVRQGREQSRQRPRRAAAASFQDRGGDGGRSERATLSQQDIKTMRDSNLDPNNNKHVLTFLGEKQAYVAENRR